MALTWPSKAPGDTYVYAWVPPFADGVDTWSFTSSGVTIGASEEEGGKISVSISGGTAGVQTITASATSEGGETATETFYLPVSATTNAFSYTANDLCSYALRKVVGTGESLSAEQLTDCLERLNDMVAAWRMDGLDIGLTLPILSATVIKTRDEFISGLKANLLLDVYPLYGSEASPFEVVRADEQKRLIRATLFQISDLAMPSALTPPNLSVADLF